MSARKNLAGISMLEIVVSMMILALILVGLMNVFVAAGNWMSHSRSRVSASQIGTVFLEPFQDAVSANTWDNNSLSVRNYTDNNNTVFINRVLYTPSYVITNTTDLGSNATINLRRVQVRIVWNETKF
jgi:Tfp pilus assembly protein PilV